MLLDYVTVLRNGDQSGNGMLLRFNLPSGLEIFGLPTENFYGGGWDLGPTWNYLVLGDEPFLLDTGRFGQTEMIMAMIEEVGFSPQDVRFVLLSHGHEDHDGGVEAFSSRTGAEIRAHAPYDRLRRLYPDLAPVGSRPDFPARCWNCFMPETFVSRFCKAYHQANNRLEVNQIKSPRSSLVNGLSVLHTPGHSPDAVCVIAGDEAVFTGDTILPEITPAPTTHELSRKLTAVLDSGEDRFFGLSAYIRSLTALKEEVNGHRLVLPAHRLYYGGKWNEIRLGERIFELIDHHVNRCADLIKIIQDEPLTARSVAERYFPESLLKGPGIFMARNEILSHLELLEDAGYVTQVDQESFLATGGSTFEGLIRGGLTPES